MITLEEKGQEGSRGRYWTMTISRYARQHGIVAALTYMRTVGEGVTYVGVEKGDWPHNLSATQPPVHLMYSHQMHFLWTQLLNSTQSGSGIVAIC